MKPSFQRDMIEVIEGYSINDDDSDIRMFVPAPPPLVTVSDSDSELDNGRYLCIQFISYTCTDADAQPSCSSVIYDNHYNRSDIDWTSANSYMV
jgi:hypothetical protein